MRIVNPAICHFGDFNRLLTDAEICFSIYDFEFVFGADEVFENFNFYTQNFQCRQFLRFRLESRRHREGEDFHALCFYHSVNAELIPLGKLARDAIEVFMQYSNAMNNNGRVVGGGAS